ncbi:hypothetical protein Q5M87_04875 [Brachyspira innocens]|uniref:Uncharacterized protein n=1 Tax=Brachyspira innocens TaxID=13264 RepID=A0ABT8YU96_9SPIR|nr:hypothetical protein [Brachyspira innocens]MDO6993338.1 hypothetical protein [Brachyspira innocens]MDO7019379.1 hypothetical protein [Brachyspira innocens]
MKYTKNTITIKSKELKTLYSIEDYSINSITTIEFKEKSIILKNQNITIKIDTNRKYKTYKLSFISEKLIKELKNNEVINIDVEGSKLKVNEVIINCLIEKE